MKYEAVLTNGNTLYVDAQTAKEALRKADQGIPIKTLRLLLENNDNYEWIDQYSRRYVDVIAYVNAWNNNNPVASIPVSVRLESYQSIKEVAPVVKEKEKVLAIWPDAIIKIQKRIIS